MSRHARIEELSDSDPSEQDPSEYLPDDSLVPIALPSRPAPASAPAPSSAQPPPFAHVSPLSPTVAPDAELFKSWACLYPVYFDATRSRAAGRRVGKELAVTNPLAREIVDAASREGLRTYFEPGKAHPKDWANPGRVKVEVRGVEGNVKNSESSGPPPAHPREMKSGWAADEVTLRRRAEHHLYILVAQYLQAHPTTPEMQLKVAVPGLPQKPAPAPHAPRGWKMGSIVPLHSPAVSGGGISDNMLKDMMAEMQGQPGAEGMALPPGLAGLPGMAGAGPGGSEGGAREGKAKKKKNKAK